MAKGTVLEWIERFSTYPPHTLVGLATEGGTEWEVLSTYQDGDGTLWVDLGEDVSSPTNNKVAGPGGTWVGLGDRDPTGGSG